MGVGRYHRVALAGELDHTAANQQSLNPKSTLALIARGRKLPLKATSWEPSVEHACDWEQVQKFLKLILNYEPCSQVQIQEKIGSNFLDTIR